MYSCSVANYVIYYTNCICIYSYIYAALRFHIHAGLRSLYYLGWSMHACMHVLHVNLQVATCIATKPICIYSYIAIAIVLYDCYSYIAVWLQCIIIAIYSYPTV